jgi:hypothetical protein
MGVRTVRAGRAAGKSRQGRRVRGAAGPARSGWENKKKDLAKRSDVEKARGGSSSVHASGVGPAQLPGWGGGPPCAVFPRKIWFLPVDVRAADALSFFSPHARVLVWHGAARVTSPAARRRKVTGGGIMLPGPTTAPRPVDLLPAPATASPSHSKSVDQLPMPLVLKLLIASKLGGTACAECSLISCL